MAFEKGDLVLVGGSRYIFCSCFDREVVVNFALVDSRGGLGDEFRPEHGLAVPFRGLVDGDFDALLGTGVGGVFVRGIEVYVFVD